MKTMMLLAVVFSVGCTGVATSPEYSCANPPPNTACATSTDAGPTPDMVGTCPGPEARLPDGSVIMGCWADAPDGCICGHRTDAGDASGHCVSGQCVEN